MSNLKENQKIFMVRTFFIITKIYLVDSFAKIGEIAGLITFGDIMWVPVGEAQMALGGCEISNVDNWPDEAHPHISGPGFHIEKNMPRYYIKKRRARNERIQYIVTRHPLVLNFASEAGMRRDPEDLANIGQPDRFANEIASIFCRRNGRLDNTRIRPFGQNYTGQWRNCGVVETLVGLCLLDLEVTPGMKRNPGIDPEHPNTFLIDEAFIRRPNAPYNINDESRVQMRLLVLENCKRFARITILPQNEYNVELWKQHIRGARLAGYDPVIVLGQGINTNCHAEMQPGEWGWADYRIIDLENNNLVLNQVYTSSIRQGMPSYWYFCCDTNLPVCNAPDLQSIEF